MINIKYIFTLFLCSVSFFSAGETTEKINTLGYISESLFIYMHSGAGKNYRILGSINSGEKVQLTGEVNNDYSQIITETNKTGWIESKHISTKPGMRYVIADLNEKLASIETEKNAIENQLMQVKSELKSLQSIKNDLTNSITALNNDLTQTKSQLKNQDTDLQKQWFFMGAIVLGFGLFLGLILPRLFSRRSSKMESWN